MEDKLNNKSIRVCPRCNREYDEEKTPHALSRIDNETEICPDCGVREALEGIERQRTTVFLNPSTVKKAKMQAIAEEEGFSFLVEKALTVYLAKVSK